MPRVKRASPYRRIPNTMSEERDVRQMTQEETARAIGVTRGVFSTWESGINLPAAAHMPKLEETLGPELYPDWVLEFMARLDGAS